MLQAYLHRFLSDWVLNIDWAPVWSRPDVSNTEWCWFVLQSWRCRPPAPSWMASRPWSWRTLNAGSLGPRSRRRPSGNARRTQPATSGRKHITNSSSSRTRRRTLRRRRHQPTAAVAKQASCPIAATATAALQWRWELRNSAPIASGGTHSVIKLDASAQLRQGMVSCILWRCWRLSATTKTALAPPAGGPQRGVPGDITRQGPHGLRNRGRHRPISQQVSHLPSITIGQHLCHFGTVVCCTDVFCMVASETAASLVEWMTANLPMNS
jgi:hypothetical protein